MKVFDLQTFRQFLGRPTLRKKHSWGIEQKFLISEASLVEYERQLRETLYHHHSSFDVDSEITALGYPRAAQAMRQRNSGNPTDDKTQMGNLGEVIGAEFGRSFLGFATTMAFPKRLNPNVDQSMKGTDILGLRGVDQAPRLLIGEAKSYRTFSRDAIDEAYDHLVALHDTEASRLLRFTKEILHLKGDRQGMANVDRHMADGVPRHSIIVSITQSRPRDPFSSLLEKFDHAQVPRLMAVHIQIQELRGKKTRDGQSSGETWLSRLFEA